MGFLGGIIGSVGGIIGGIGSLFGGGGDGLSADINAISDAIGQIGQQAQAVEGIQSMINQALQPILGGAWVGNGANAFTGEVTGTLLPAIADLIASISGLGSLANVGLDLLQQADQAASGIVGVIGDAIDAVGDFLGGL